MPLLLGFAALAAEPPPDVEGRGLAWRGGGEVALPHAPVPATGARTTRVRADPRPERQITERPHDGPGTARAERDDTDRPGHAGAACTGADGSACPHPVLPGADAVDAVRVERGAVVAERDGTVTRLQLGLHGQLVRWRTRVPVPDATADDPTLRLSGAESGVLVASTDGIHRLGADDGEALWSTALEAGEEPWRTWVLDRTVLAVGRDRLAALDLADGAVRWERGSPTGAVQPTAAGIAVLEQDRVASFAPDAAEPAWSAPLPPRPVSPFGLVAGEAGPVVTLGDEVRLLDAGDGAEVARLGPRATATRARDGTTVVARWEDPEAPPTLEGLEPDGGRRWSRPGPELRCCGLLLRPTEEGHVAAITLSRGRRDVGELLEPADGASLGPITRPADANALPVAVASDASVWLDGSALLGAGTVDGEPRWRAETGSTVLLESPLLIATRDGVLAP